MDPMAWRRAGANVSSSSAVRVEMNLMSIKRAPTLYRAWPTRQRKTTP
jgi:hypothetical protein